MNTFRNNKQCESCTPVLMGTLELCTRWCTRLECAPWQQLVSVNKDAIMC